MVEGVEGHESLSETQPTERLRELSSRAVTVVVDFDGTVTETETLDLLVREFGDSQALTAANARLGVDLHLRDVIRAGYGGLRVDRAAACEWLLRNARVREGFGALVALARGCGWRLVIVSSGIRELIEPLLEREGLAHVELLANGLREGWDVEFVKVGDCPVCGEPCKRPLVERLVAPRGVLVYIGDGYSDGCAALVADVVFARRRLVNYLETRGVPFEPFESFVTIVERLRRTLC
jgi:2-hydroxy-3-keto-5-methylthiopentenyl-1-phosphate phosphatase